MIHVVDPPTSNVLELAEDARVLERAVREAASKRLDAEMAALAEHGVSVQGTVLAGKPDEILTREAKEAKARMIVVGTHGRQTPWRWFLGSVAQRAVQRADRPVLVVREDRGRFGKWATGKARLRMVVGVDMSPATDAALSWVRRLCGLAACEPTFVHAIPSFGWGSLTGTKELVTQELHRQLGDLVASDRSLLRIIPTAATPADAMRFGAVRSDAAARGAGACAQTAFAYDSRPDGSLACGQSRDRACLRPPSPNGRHGRGLPRAKPSFESL